MQNVCTQFNHHGSDTDDGIRNTWSVDESDDYTEQKTKTKQKNGSEQYGLLYM